VEVISNTVPTANILWPLGGGNSSRKALLNASSDKVLSALPNATILHLACHGQQNAENPLESGFVMQNGLLTISRLISLELPNTFLAFLSACETAKGDERQPNQVIHLAAAMLFAGFRSVVGTMW
jgi:CHAT domain-containing protein